MYQYLDKSHWQGRYDGDAPEVLRWHQCMEMLDISSLSIPSVEGEKVALLGFVSEEGVRRNKGRVGAAQAPEILRKMSSNFPVLRSKQHIGLYDAGNCVCEYGDLEAAHEEFATHLGALLKAGYRTLGLGGGHEITYGHYQAMKRAFPDAKIGVINFDAHFDIRPIEEGIGRTSGTSFWQIAHEEKDFHYLALGIQENSNTQLLFDIANHFGVDYVWGKNFNYDDRPAVIERIKQFIEKVDVVYLTICMDVFAAPYAPGVSALAYNGICPDKIFQDYFQTILGSPKLKSMDIAELNPTLDIDNRTARLATSLIFEYVYRPFLKP